MPPQPHVDCETRSNLQRVLQIRIELRPAKVRARHGRDFEVSNSGLFGMKKSQIAPVHRTRIFADSRGQESAKIRVPQNSLLVDYADIAIDDTAHIISMRCEH